MIKGFKVAGDQLRRGSALALIAGALVLSTPLEARVQEVKEHPVVKLYPGAEVASSDQKAYDAARMVIARKGAALPMEEVEGRVTRYTFAHPAGTSPVQVVRNFENALREAGFVTVAMESDFDIDGGLHDRFGAFKRERPGEERIYVNVASSGNSESARTDVTVVDVKAMVQEYAVNADSLYAGLQSTGRVTLEGVTFDTAKTTLRPDSLAVLGEAKKLLTAHPELKLSVEGHTDDVGAAAANQTLSAGRAEAVKAWLVANGVEAGRLTAAGFGATRPLSPNTDEGARAKNRRVELVRR